MSKPPDALENPQAVSDTRKHWMLLAVAIFLSSLSKLALAQSNPPCSGPEIVLAMPHPEQARWQTLRTELSEHLKTVRDLDRCARLTLNARGDALVLDARTSDNRFASRTVRTQEQLLHASEALLTLPPNTENSHPAVLPVEEPHDSPSSPDPRIDTPIRPAHVELGAAASARLGGAPWFVAGGVTGFADAVVQPWLLGVSARWDISGGLISQPTLMDYFLMSTAVGVHVGRRFEVSGATLDVLLGPNLVLEFQDADDGQLDIAGSAADVRIDLGARLSAPRRARVRAFGSADLELSPARLLNEQHANPSLPALPSFSFGLAVGVLWSSQ
ncbi:MAG TPA: hypothetical protein VER96_11410 [Polyangiaceae bacterium]|nr:hypothetical protein [Polyangiaceae bacterium]